MVQRVAAHRERNGDVAAVVRYADQPEPPLVFRVLSSRELGAPPVQESALHVRNAEAPRLDLAGRTLRSCYSVRNIENEEEGRMTIAGAKLTSKYQITLPAEIRRRLGLAAGDVVYLTIEEGEVVLRSARGGWTQSTRGLGAEVWRAEGGGEAAIEKERGSWE